MKKYGDLDLRLIREQYDLAFAHWTFKRGQCSCCYGIDDQPRLYWSKKYRKLSDREMQDLMDSTPTPYILFKNADNGSGHKTKADDIGHANILWGDMDTDIMWCICYSLARQLDEDYIIEVPNSNMRCIYIRTIKELEEALINIGVDNMKRTFDKSTEFVITGGSPGTTILIDEYEDWLKDMYNRAINGEVTLTIKC